MPPTTSTTLPHSPTVLSHRAYKPLVSTPNRPLTYRHHRCRRCTRRSCCSPNGASLAGRRQPPRPTLRWCFSCRSCRPTSPTTISFARPRWSCRTHAGGYAVSPAPAGEEVRTPLSFPLPRPRATVSVLPCSTVQLPVQVEDTTSTTTIPSSASALIPSAKKGMTGPQMAALQQVKFDTGVKRCAHAQPRHAQHSPHTTSGVHCTAHTRPSPYSRASAGSCMQHNLCHRL